MVQPNTLILILYYSFYFQVRLLKQKQARARRGSIENNSDIGNEVIKPPSSKSTVTTEEIDESDDDMPTLGSQSKEPEDHCGQRDPFGEGVL